MFAMENFNITKTKLLSIRELRIPGDVLVNEARLFQYTRGPLLTFIERFPQQEERIRDALGTQDYGALARHLRDVCGRLKVIHAEDMAYECQKKMEKLPDIKQEVVETYVTYFLTAVSMLSIDLQMVIFKETDDREANKNIVVAETREIKRPDAPKGSILAVDDAPFFLKTLKQTLQNSDYELDVVTSGQVALQYLQNRRPNLFLLDIEMPEMNGYELAKKIREAGHTAPILFLTSNAQQECVLRAIEAGAADFVLKPINGEYLLARIEKHIQ